MKNFFRKLTGIFQQSTTPTPAVAHTEKKLEVIFRADDESSVALQVPTTDVKDLRIPDDARTFFFSEVDRTVREDGTASTSMKAVSGLYVIFDNIPLRQQIKDVFDNPRHMSYDSIIIIDRHKKQLWPVGKPGSFPSDTQAVKP